MLIPDYEILEKMAESPQSAVFKACHKKDPARLLVLKLLKASSLSEGQEARFRQKIEHLKVLTDSLVITPLSFESQDDVCFLTQEYYAGVTLDRVIEARQRISLRDFFTVACGVAQALEAVHQAGIIHGGIKPHNILVDPTTLEVRLIDFVSAIDVQDVSHFIYEPFFIRGTLAYTSPEQTGRINHKVVFASDLYSLGIVLYELLTGRVPFLSDDPLEMIHSHLAGEAPPAHEVRPDVPRVVSKIIAKLMLKEPEKRYQSSGGLLVDLRRCEEEYSAIGTIRDFPLETAVSARRVAFVSRMVGRGEEAKIVLDEYECACGRPGGAFRAVFISGFPGIGKTRLIQELQKPMVEHRGYFTSGKFDIYQKNIPYSSLTQALRSLMRTFLTESDERVALWKGRILQAVGQDGKVLTDVIPELETLMGRQPDVAPLPPVESLHRFHDLFGRFLTSLATKENPLILFIDDLQWCDAASFDFLSEVFRNHQEHQYLFLLGAYRHNEVDSSHPLSRLIRSAREGNRPLKEIRLDALKPEHCHEMVSYVLDSPPEQTWALAQYLSVLTEGNPLFVNEGLAYLHNEGLLRLDTERQWQWDIDKVCESRMPTTVVGLFSSKIQKLPPDTVSLLEYCACMGNVIAPSDLSSIREVPLWKVFEMLKPALEQGLVIEYRNRLQFIHDRVQEAVLSAIPAQRRRRLHWDVGTRLRACIPDGTIPDGTRDCEKLDNLFAIVAHLNLGIAQEPDPETAYLVSDLDYHAGNKALDSLAIEAANRYFNLSRELLPDDRWSDSHYERTFNIFRKAAKTELMGGNYERSERLLNELVGHARTDLDRAECLAEQTISLSSIGNFSQAIATANRGLAYFGKAIPDDPRQVDSKTKELLAEILSKDIDVREALLSMPFTTDRKKKVESAFYSELLADLYFSGRVPELYLVGAQATLHCLEGGMDEGIIYGFTVMGLYHGEQEEFQRSFLYEDLTYDLAAKYPNTFAATKCMNGTTWTMMHTRSHPRDIVDYSLKALQCGRSCGDINNAAIAYGPVMWNLQVQGADLSAIEDYATECLQFATRYHVLLAMRLAEATRAGWVAPMKKDYAPAPMEEKISQWEKDNHFAALGNYCVHRAAAHYYFGEHEEAERELARAERFVTGVTNSVLKREWHVFRVLNAIKLHESRRGSRRLPEADKLVAETRPFLTKIEKWASLGPVFKPYLAFIRAELERVAGEFREARSLYLDAIDAAHGQEYTFLAGHLNECLGELLRQAGQHSEAGYFAEAARLYRQCGADRKELRLRERYPLATAVTTTTTTTTTLPELDTEYLMKSALAISAEMEQDALSNRIMKVVIESSGAQAGYLLIQDQGKLFVRAGSHVAEKAAPRIQSQRLDDVTSICKPIVRYVQRTGDRVILNEACEEGMFKDYPEVQDMRLRSVLCLPVVKQSRMLGILYLENRLTGRLFTPEKVRMMELLSSQAAISIENARLVDDMKRAKEEWESTFNTVPDLLMILDRQHRVVRVNRAAADRLGLAPEQCIGLHCYEAVHGLSRPPEFCPHALTCQDGREHATDVHEPRLGGDFLVSTTPMRDGNGELIGSIHIARDITERKRVEEAVRESQQLLQRMADLNPAVISLRDLVNHEEIYSSKPALVLLGYRPEEIEDRGSFSASVIHPEDLPKLMQAVRELQVAADDQVRRIDFRVRDAGGQWRWFQTAYIVFKRDATGKPLQSLAVSLEITETKQSEERIRELNEGLLRRAVELEASNKELEAFSYSVSHDLRAPLRHMDGFSRLVLEGYADKLDDEGKEYLQIVRSSSELMAKLIDDLLDLSRIGRAEISLEKVDLSELAVEVVSELKRSHSERNVDWILAAGLEAYGDRQLLKLVLDNLLGNALKFSSKRDIARIEFGVTDHSGEFFVRDNGVGFDMTYADKLFKPFQRLHKADQFPGTGIGLASVHRIIGRLGGRVRAEGEIDKGATVYFTLRQD